MDIRRILKETIWTNIHEVSILGKYRILLFFSLNFLIYVSVMTYFGLVRFQDLLAPTFDMGVKIQTIFTSINGIPIDTANYVTNAGIGGINFFATHFSPLTFALSPFLHFFPPAIFLLGFQWTCIYLASPLIYLIAKIEGLSERNSLIISTLYLLYPPMIMSGMYDIHFLALYPLASLMIYYGFKKSNYFLYIFGFILGWAAQESFFLLATFFIILLYIEKKPGFKSIFSPALIDKKDLILIVSFILSLVVYFYEVFIYMKGFVPNRPNPLFSSNGYHLSIENIFINPVQKFEYWFFVFLFLGFIPALGSKKLILILPAFILTLFTTHYFYYFLFQYSFLYVSGIFLAFVSGFNKILQHHEQKSIFKIKKTKYCNHKIKNSLIYILILLIIFSPMLPVAGYLPDHPRVINDYYPSSELKSFNNLIHNIPINASVLASDTLFPHVADRENAFPILYNYVGGKYIPYNYSLSTLNPKYVLIYSYDLGTVSEIIKNFSNKYSLFEEVNYTYSYFEPLFVQNFQTYHILLYKATLYP